MFSVGCRMTNQASSTDTSQRSLAIRALEAQGDIVTVKTLLEPIEALYKGEGPQGISTGWPVLDRYFSIFKKQLTVVSGIPNHGKALALDTKIPTVDGWKTMADIAVGDVVFDESGRKCNVLHVFDVMENRPCYEITFGRGGRVVADAEHSWPVFVGEAKEMSNITTEEIKKALLTINCKFNCAVGCDSGMEFERFANFRSGDFDSWRVANTFRSNGPNVIWSVERVSSVPVRCISVDSPSRLYLVTEHLIPTHNSEIMDGIIINTALNNGWKWGVFSPENYPYEYHFQKLSEKVTNTPFVQTPLRKLGDAIQLIDKHVVWTYPNDPTIDALKGIFKTLVMTHGVDAILLDPYNEIEHKQPHHMSETNYISWFLTDMRRFARKYDVALFIVAHPSMMKADSRAGQDRSKPPLMNVYDINGSAAWANKSDNVIIVYRPDFNKDETQLHVQKVRFKFTGRKGFVTLKYAYETGIYFV